MHIFITGAAGGIGAALVAACRREGHAVSACDIDSSALDTLYGEDPGVANLQLDVTDAQAWQQVFGEAWTSAPVDVLVNVAGVLRAGVTGELDSRDVALQLNVNLLGLIYGTNTAAQHMLERGDGHIINVGSTASVFATPGNGVYAASKHGVRGFTIAAAGDLRPQGIEVSLVCPTGVKTAMLEQQRGDVRSALTFAGARALTPEEVATAIVGDVMRDKPLELYLPRVDQWKGRLCTSFPEYFLSRVDDTRSLGIANFDSPDY